MAPEAPAAPADQKETIIHFNKTVACRLLNIVSGSRNLDYGIGGGGGDRPGATLMCQLLGVDVDVAATHLRRRFYCDRTMRQMFTFDNRHGKITIPWKSTLTRPANNYGFILNLYILKSKDESS